MPYTSVVTVTVYNMLGQQVATLVDHEQMDDGGQSVDFDASQLSTGVYFYQIIADQIPDDNTVPGDRFVGTKKMMLIK